MLAFDDIAAEFYTSLEAPAKADKQSHTSLAEEMFQVAALRLKSDVATFQEAMSRVISKAFENDDLQDALLPLRHHRARIVLDALQEWLDLSAGRGRTEYQFRLAIRLLVKLSSLSGELPPSLFLSRVDIGGARDPTAVGGFADIFRGTYRRTTVAVKRLRVGSTDREKSHRAFCREALVWRQLEHPHVLPFFGVDTEIFGSMDFICMVSPWLQNGNLLQFMRTGAYYFGMRDRLLREVADGLTYLHSLKVAHGDIHGGNIFIDDLGHARLGDFGIAIIGDETMTHSTSASAGTARWTAPERIIAQKQDRSLRFASDVWAFGCLFVLLYTQKRLYPHLPNDYSVLFHVSQGGKPARPRSRECQGAPMSDAIWSVATLCWTRNVRRRPSIQKIYQCLVDIENNQVGYEQKGTSGKKRERYEDEASVSISGKRPRFSQTLKAPADDSGGNDVIDIDDDDDGGRTQFSKYSEAEEEVLLIDDDDDDERRGDLANVMVGGVIVIDNDDD